MANDVFANGLEVACKAADGVSAAAFPDVCFTPKYPAPFANTAYAKDITNGSKTVFISGKEVALKDHSYIKCSSGDMGARGRKGMSTGAKNGKAYFRSWSMNVKVEGYNVCRHTDSMTHNHNPTQGNTGEWKYLDTADRKKCKKDKKRVDDACKVSEKENRRFRKKQERKNRRLILKGKANKTTTVRNKTWKDKNCKAVLIKPTVDELKKGVEKLSTESDEIIKDLKQELIDRGIDMAKDAGEAYLKRAGIKQAAGLGCGIFAGVGAIVCEAVIGVYNLADAAVTGISTGIEMYGASSEIAQAINSIKEGQKNAKKALEFLNDSKLTPAQLEKKKQELKEDLEDNMQKAVENNKCLSARKCMLTPFAKSKQGDLKQGENAGKGKRSDFFAKMGLGDSRGCCPGQTGHHLIPDSWVKDKCGSNYSHADAPVVCMEGTSHSTGTHGEIHSGLNKVYDDTIEKRAGFLGGNNKYGIDSVIDMAVASHKQVYDIDWPGLNWSDGCDKECLKAQLKSYYKNKGCMDIEPKKIGREAEEINDEL